MKNSKQLKKLKNLHLKAQQCLTRDEAKKIIIKATKAQGKISIQNLFKIDFQESQGSLNN